MTLALERFRRQVCIRWKNKFRHLLNAVLGSDLSGEWNISCARNIKQNTAQITSFRLAYFFSNTSPSSQNSRSENSTGRQSQSHRYICIVVPFLWLTWKALHIDMESYIHGSAFARDFFYREKFFLSVEGILYITQTISWSLFTLHINLSSWVSYNGKSRSFSFPACTCNHPTHIYIHKIALIRCHMFEDRWGMHDNECRHAAVEFATLYRGNWVRSGQIGQFKCTFCSCRWFHSYQVLKTSPKLSTTLRSMCN